MLGRKVSEVRTPYYGAGGSPFIVLASLREDASRLENVRALDVYRDTGSVPNIEPVDMALAS